MDFDLDKLTEAMKRKTNKIIGLKEQCDVQKYKYTRVGLLCLIPLVYIIFFSERIFNYLLLIFGENVQVDSFLFKLDIIIVFIFIACAILFYLYYSKYIVIKKQFESLRVDIIGNIEKGLCACKRECDCDSKYVKYMDKYGIDVVFI